MSTSEIRRVAVVGAGLMGAGIAQEFALAGYPVSLNDVSDEALSQAIENIAANLSTLQDMGLVSAAQSGSVTERIQTSASLESTASDADFVIEAIVEDLPVKRAVFSQLDSLSPEHAIIASNTSTFMPSQLASATGRPDRVLVAHYFNPPYLIPLVEVVRGPETSDETVEAVRGLLLKLGKSPVLLQREAPGFVVNRLQIALLREAISLVEKGIASAEDIDVVVKSSFGRRLAAAGPFEIFDSAGWDIIAAIMSEILPDIESSTEVPAMVTQMVERGDLGLKTGRGVYSWTPESAAALRQKIGRALAAMQELAVRG